MRSYKSLLVVASIVAGGMAGAHGSGTSGELLAEALYGHHAPSKLAKAVTFHDAMRKLWEDHIVWTRGFIVSVAHDLPDADETATRLLANQVHIGDALKPFYGTANGNHVTELLQEHILIAAEILTAAKAGDDDAVAEALGRWYENGDEIADFLANLNRRYWSRDELRMMMEEHLNTTLAEAVARLSGDYAGDIAHYEVVHEHILMMADTLSNGIIAQQPGKFR
jgi:hypothetical protein